ncbi:hypothetical protein RZS08_21260 [Arthrospira platensis SPKY1]|nr:hypothetical protein [Arthrospira platensis SPKY1]
MEFVTDRLGHDFRYAIDSSKIEQEVGWQAQTDFESALRNTVDYFVQRFR